MARRERLHPDVVRVLVPSLGTLVVGAVMFALSGGLDPLDDAGEPRWPALWFAVFAIALMVMAAVGLGVSAWVWARGARRARPTRASRGR